MRRLSTLLALATLTTAFAADWDRFRGPNGSGVIEAAGLPTEFGPNKNVAWKSTVPFGRSSPVAANGRIFLTAVDNNKLVTLALDANTGKTIWRKELDRAHAHKTYKANDPASSTPAVDDHGVYVFFADFGLVSYSPADGKERWKLPLGPFDSFYGMAASPIVANGMVILLCDQARGSYLLAVDRDNGRQRWKTERKQHLDSWSVPIVHNGRILTFGSTRVDSYQLATGESQWWIPIASNGGMGNPVIYKDTLILTAQGSDQPMVPAFATALEQFDKNRDGKLSEAEFAEDKEFGEHFNWVDTNKDGQIDAKEWEFVRSYGTGDWGVLSIPLDNHKGPVDASAIRWRYKRGVPYIPSPLLYDGVFFMVRTGGIVTSLNPATGAVIRQGRSGDKAGGEYWASPIGADGRIFVLSGEGKLAVLKPGGGEWESLAVNDLGEDCYATPAVAGNKLIVRTAAAVYAFASQR